MTQTKAELLQTRHQGDIRLGDADSSHYVGFKAPATVSSSLVWTLPAADGTANYLLKTDGSGNLAWTADNSGVSLSGSTNNTIATVTGANALAGEANFTFDGDTAAITRSANTAAGFTISNTNNSQNSAIAQLELSGGDNAHARVQFECNGNYNTIRSDGNGNLQFFKGSDERLRIDSAGKVGIGNTSPQGQLHIGTSVGTSNREAIIILNNGGATGQEAGIEWRYENNTTPRAKIHLDSSGQDLRFATANSERLRIGSSGQLGIGGATYGSSGQVLTSGGGSAAPTWADAAGGGATPTVKTANYTAASGDLVVVNGSGLTITLPSSPSVADSVEVRILGSRYCTIARNGSNIESTASDFYIDTFDGHTKFIYTDSTRGWLVA